MRNDVRGSSVRSSRNEVASDISRANACPTRSADRPNRHALSVFWIVSLCVIIAGCSTHSVKTVQLQSDEVGSGGVTYFLPMRYASVAFERARVDSKAVEAVTKAKDAAKVAEIALKGAEAAASSNAALIDALRKDGFDQTSETFKGAQLELVKARREVVARTEALAKAKASLDKANESLQQYNNAQPMCGYVDSIKIDLLPPVPDTRARYQLSPQRSAMRHDTFALGTTPSGLLKTVDATLVDQTGEILISLAKSVVAARYAFRESSTGITYDKGIDDTTNCDRLDWQPVSLKTIIDPANSEHLGKISGRISKAAHVPCKPTGAAAPVAGAAGCIDRSFDYKLTLDTLGLSAAAPPDILPQHARICANGSRHARQLTEDAFANGIFYRRERPLLVKVELSNQPAGAVALVVPNDAPADVVCIEATTFASNTANVGFDNGMLVSVDSDHPSPVLEVVSIPWKIARATVGILAEIIQLRVNYASGQADVVEQQVELLAQMQALIDAQRALEATRAGESPDDDDADTGEGG